MNTIRANLLPCAGTAGGVPVHPHAAGQHVIICGDLSARRPGDSEARGTFLAVSRHRLRLAIGNSFGALKALRSLSRQKAHQPCSIGMILAGPASLQHVVQSKISFRDALAFHLQESIGATHEHGAIIQDRGFFSQGETDG